MQLQANLKLLQQAGQWLDGVTEEEYSRNLAPLGGASCGGHLRHILEFYECLLEGAGTGYVDYDSRRRDTLLESRREAARRKLDTICDRLPSLRPLDTLWVRTDGSCAASSFERELQVVASHTTHHFALLAAATRLMGKDVPQEFGVAPSTLRHWRQKAEAA